MAVKILTTRQAMKILHKSTDAQIFHKTRKLSTIIWDWGKSRFLVKFNNGENMWVGNWAYFSYKLRDIGESWDE